jgi:hypothetical protein
MNGLLDLKSFDMRRAESVNGVMGRRHRLGAKGWMSSRRVVLSIFHATVNSCRRKDRQAKAKGLNLDRLSCICTDVGPGDCSSMNRSSGGRCRNTSRSTPYRCEQEEASAEREQQ